MRANGGGEEIGGEFSDAAAVTISNRHPEDMVRTVAEGFPVELAVVGNKTLGLKGQEDTEVLALNEVYEEVTGKEEYLSMSSEEFHSVIAGKSAERIDEDVVEKFHNRYQDCLNSIQQESGEILVFPYETSQNLQDARDGDSNHWLAPENEDRREMESKTKMYQAFQDAGIDTIPGGVANGIDEAIDLMHEYDNGEGVFVAREVGSGGMGSAHIQDSSEIGEVLDESDEALVTGWIDHSKIRGNPNVQMIVTEDDVSVYAASDQVIEGGTGWRGNTSYDDLEEGVKQTMIDTCERIGSEVLGDRFGDTGVLAIDGMLYDGDFLPIEVNPRKNGSTAMKMAQLETRREGTPLIAQEAQAVAGSRSYIDNESDPVDDIGEGWEMYVIMNPGNTGQHYAPEAMMGTEKDWPEQEYIMANAVPEGVKPSDSMTPGGAPGDAYVELGKLITSGEEARYDALKKLGV